MKCNVPLNTSTDNSSENVLYWLIIFIGAEEFKCSKSFSTKQEMQTQSLIQRQWLFSGSENTLVCSKMIMVTDQQTKRNVIKKSPILKNCPLFLTVLARCSLVMQSSLCICYLRSEYIIQLAMHKKQCKV